LELSNFKGDGFLADARLLGDKDTLVHKFDEPSGADPPTDEELACALRYLRVHPEETEFVHAEVPDFDCLSKFFTNRHSFRPKGLPREGLAARALTAIVVARASLARAGVHADEFKWMSRPRRPRRASDAEEVEDSEGGSGEEMEEVEEEMEEVEQEMEEVEQEEEEEDEESNEEEDPNSSHFLSRNLMRIVREAFPMEIEDPQDEDDEDDDERDKGREMWTCVKAIVRRTIATKAEQRLAACRAPHPESSPIALYNPLAHFAFQSEAATVSAPNLDDALCRFRLRERPLAWGIESKCIEKCKKCSDA
jgi:hypothetical protein